MRPRKLVATSTAWVVWLRASSGRVGIAASALECTVCLAIFVEPVTLACGHTFCEECLEQSLAFDNRCPLCRGEVEKGPYIENRHSTGIGHTD